MILLTFFLALRENAKKKKVLYLLSGNVVQQSSWFYKTSGYVFMMFQ